MCLSSVYHVFKNPVSLNVPKIGYKVGDIMDKTETRNELLVAFRKPLEFDNWIMADNKPIISSTKVGYTSGFHILLNLKDAISYCRGLRFFGVFECKYNEITCFGYESYGAKNFDCAVANSIKVKRTPIYYQ